MLGLLVSESAAAESDQHMLGIPGEIGHVCPLQPARLQSSFRGLDAVKSSLSHSLTCLCLGHQKVNREEFVSIFVIYRLAISK